MRANETYSKAKRQFSDRNRDVLMNVQSPHKWWSTLKSAVFGSSSSLPPIVSEGGELVCESVGKAEAFPQPLFRLTPGNTVFPRMFFFVSLTATSVSRCYPVAIKTRF